MRNLFCANWFFLNGDFFAFARGADGLLKQASFFCKLWILFAPERADFVHLPAHRFAGTFGRGCCFPVSAAHTPD
jgi:hypothetical protein